jgi:hypothetical protein
VWCSGVLAWGVVGAATLGSAWLVGCVVIVWCMAAMPHTWELEGAEGSSSSSIASSGA